MSHIAVAAYKKSPQAGSAPALLIDGQLYDLDEVRAAGVDLGGAWTGNSVPAILARWDRAAATSAAAAIRQSAQAGKLKAVADGAAKLTAPYRPERIFCAASNYIEHANEMGTVLAAKADSKPYMFLKLRNTVIGPNDAIRMPPETAQLDWEIELAAVIGKGGRRIPAAQALDHVAGYAIVNDISARDL